MCLSNFASASKLGTATMATSCDLGFSRNRNTSRVMIPRVPSDPMNICLRS